MIEEGHFKVLGGNHIIYIFLCKSKATIAQKLYPGDLENKIKAMIGWHQAKMAIPGQQLFRMLYEPYAFTNQPTQSQYDKFVEEFCGNLQSLDDKLASSTFLCGSSMTVADIIIFCEIS